MDPNILAAVITSVTTAASTAGVAITAIVLQNKRVDRIETKLDRIEERLTTGFDSLTGAMHELDKRVGIIEDRIFKR